MPIAVHSAAPRLPARSNTAQPRKQPSASNSESVIIFTVVIVVTLCSSVLLYVVLRHLRARGYKPKYVPGTWLKKKWEAWTPSSQSSSQFRNRTRSTADSLGLTDRSASTSRPSTRTRMEDNGVDRQTSVRSVATLPAYSAQVRETETVMGREGERAGIDTVLEFPETVDEEEQRREEEMESLFQIRQARRDERSAREERRQLRREARARGDRAEVAVLRQQDLEIQNADANSEASADALLRQHRSKDRGRRVSSVSYQDLGVARHDGSRVRAGSNESDRLPLMDSAASMGGRDRSQSRSESRPLYGHTRTVSASSALTPDISDDDRSSAEFELISTRQSRSESGSGLRLSPRLTLSSPDLSSGVQESRHLPQYDELSPVVDQDEPERDSRVFPAHLRPADGEEAPAYESPARTDAPRLPGFSRLPSIQVTPFTPVTPSSSRPFSAT